MPNDVNENTFEIYAQALSELSQELIEQVLKLQARYARKIADNPTQAVVLQRELREESAALIAAYNQKAKRIVGENLPKAYLRGVKSADGELKGLTRSLGTINTKQLLVPSGVGAIPPSSEAIRLLEKYPRHLTLYSVFQAAAERDIDAMRLPILRSAEDGFRQLSILSSEPAYREANTLTRRQLSQSILDRASDRGLTGIIYSDGRRVGLDSYAEMVARTQTGNASRQAQMNRQSQWGFDLVRISSHSPCSELCFPWQGRVYTLRESDKYPPLEEAIAGGLYHSNCKHTQSAYIPGVSEKLENPGRFSSSKRKNEKGYEAQKRQRQIERNIRKYKKREAVAITPDAQKKAKAKISEWQKEARKNINDNPYLRRAYNRESITATGRRVGGKQ